MSLLKAMLLIDDKTDAQHFLQGTLLLREVCLLLIGFLGQIQDCAHGVCCPPLPQQGRSDRLLAQELLASQ